MSDHPAPASEPRGENWAGSAAVQLIVVVPVLAYLVWTVARSWDELTLEMLFFVLVVAVIDLIPVPGWGGLQLSLSFPLLLGVVIVFEPGLAALIAFLGSFDPRELRGEVSVLKALWNRSQMALSILAAGALFHLITDVNGPWTTIVPAILAAAVAGYIVNTACVAIQTSVYLRVPLLEVLAKMHGSAPYEFLLSYLGLGLLGAVIARFYLVEGAWSVLVLLGPLVFARQMYFRSRSLADRLAEQNEILADQARKLEELLESEHHTVDELIELNRMKGEFVAVVSHELRTPVTALIGYAKTLQHPEFSDDPAIREEFLERMVRQGDRLLRLVENLLTASRIENRQLPLSVGRVVFDDLLREVMEGLAVSVDRIRLDVPADLPVLHTDRQLLGRVIQNLLDNALKYSREGTPCELGARSNGERLVFWVRDHGIGIPADELPRIFDRFYQVDSSSTRTASGAGLGLSLVKDLLQQLGGSIEVESAPEEGSRFTVTVPFRHPTTPLGDEAARPSSRAAR